MTVWLGVGRLALAFLRRSNDWRYVAEQSWGGAPWYYRLAGVWGGMEGSLLLFAAIAATVLAVGARRATIAVQLAGLATVAAITLVDVVMASPFDRLDVPAVDGFGMNPILEHPAMAVHPPLLYAGLAAAGGAAVAAWGGVGHAGRREPVRRWHLVTMAALVASMTLGAAWSYMEQGWGGYWAWDPVENTSLAVWLGALLALHVPATASALTRRVADTVPWLLALLGASLVRSGRTPSIHGFAEQLDVGWALFGLGAGTAVAVLVAGLRLARARVGGPAPRQPTDDPRVVTVVLVAAAAAVAVAGTVAPTVIDLVTGRASAIRGVYFSRTVGPLALVGLPFLVAQLRRRQSPSSLAAHVGMVVLLAGIAVSTFDRAATVPVALGSTVAAAGTTVSNGGVDMVDGPRSGSTMVRADLDVGGRAMSPSIVVYPDRGGRLAEVAVRTGWWTDVHAVLDDASDAETVVVTVQRRHGMWLVWLGSAVVAVATVVAGRRRAVPDRRRVRSAATVAA